MKSPIARAFLSILLILIYAEGLQAQERIRYFINDPSGSPVQVLDADGAVVARYAYAPFGSQVAPQVAANQRLGFVGGIRDTTSLHYLKHRYYNPLLGRFYQPDPVGFLERGRNQINRYGYGLNDPYTYQDKDGRCLPACAALIPLAIWALDNMRSDVPNTTNTPPSGVGDAAVMGYAIGGIAASATIARWAAGSAAMDYGSLVATANANAAKAASTTRSLGSVSFSAANGIGQIYASEALIVGETLTLNGFSVGTARGLMGVGPKGAAELLGPMRELVRFGQQQGAKSINITGRYATEEGASLGGSRIGDAFSFSFPTNEVGLKQLLQQLGR